MVNQVIRIGVANNFNGTDLEFEQVEHFSFTMPEKSFFVNSNINSKELKNIGNYSFKSVITVNPDLVVKSIPSIIKRIEAIKSTIAFVRVKYLPNNESILNLIYTLNKQGYPIVITNQRFSSKISCSKYSSLEYYKFSNGYLRLTDIELNNLYKIVDSLSNVFICDRNKKGCGDCGLCSTLTIGENLPVSSLNLSSSGICPFNCPDCFAKRSQHQYKDKVTGKVKISFDTIAKNMKQKGTLKQYQK